MVRDYIPAMMLFGAKMVWLSFRVFAVAASRFCGRDGGKETRTDVIRGRCSATERDFAG